MNRLTTLPLRQTLQPMIDGAVLAASHPALKATGIEIEHIEAADGDGAVGLRVFLYYPGPALFRLWAEAIGATGRSEAKRTSRPGEGRRTVTGRVGTTPIEVTCVDREPVSIR